MKLQSARIENRSRRSIRRILLVSFVAVCVCGLVYGQSDNLSQTRSSDLERANLSLVSASAADIKAVLVKDAGLMVELKRWVATDATNHGQVVSESDLTDAAIFDRLESDSYFRGIATQLLQRYGYLVPKVNPDSPQGKEQDLLVQERVKWISQQEAEQRSAEYAKQQQDLKDLETARACARGTEQAQDCPQTQRTIPLQQIAQPRGVGPQGIPLAPQNGTSPGGQPNLPYPVYPGPQPNNLIASSDPTLALMGFDLGSSGLGGSSLSSGFGGPSGASNSLLGGQGLGRGVGQGSSSNLNLLASQNGFPSGDFSGLDAMSSLAAMSNPYSYQYPYSTSSGYGGGLQTMSPAYPLGTPVVPFNSYSNSRISAANFEPTLARVRNPYRDIPSLYDMYLQATPRPATPQRFGSEVFENGVRDPQLIPMDMPAGPDYVVGPGDGLTISLWGGISRQLFQTVDREGRVNLPEAGPVLVSGKTLGDVQQEVQRTLKTQFRDVSADVSLSRLRTIRVYEVGDVVTPGAYDISSLSTPLNGLFAAGGATPRGSLRIVRHYRGNQLLQEVDLYDLLLHGVRNGMAPLENGDTILVPPAGPQVTIDGMVRRPAIYELKDEKNLAQIIELAGGLLPIATLRHIEVQRLMAHEKQTMLSLNIPDTDGNAEVAQKLEAFEVQDGDQIRIFPIAQGNEDAVYLEGHVIRPGKYAYRNNMRVSDVLGSFKDLLPEPAGQYAEIIRLSAPDFHPTVESFNLTTALADPSQSPLLQPMDTIRIFSRYDFENAPSVSVLGDVRGPGTYETAGQIHLSDAVHLAGGLAADAKTDDAQVFRYLPDGKMTIFSVNLTAALAGDATHNILLTPRDRVLVHRSPDANDPATVWVEGQVGRPGRYPLATNMTIGDLIRVGGGLQPSADVETADLTRYAWQGTTKLAGQQHTVNLASALRGDSEANLTLHNGDVVTIRQVPGWKDLGASISVQGEVVHPGTYGIRPGERLSSILQRAGGFQSSAYPYGAILERTQVRELQAKQQNELLLRVKDAQQGLLALPDNQAKQAALAQYQSALTQLAANPPVGRVAIRISGQVKQWQNSAADVAVRDGDTLFIPKRPDYVMVTGQVFNPTAVSYRPGRNAKWYLSQSGGGTTTANKKAIFVIRADGSIISTNKSMWGGDSLSAVLQPGDTVVVPEKVPAGGTNWQAVFGAVQVASSIVSTVFIALHY